MGAKAGIGAGVGLAGVAALALAAWWVVRRRGARAVKARSETAGSSVVGMEGPVVRGWRRGGRGTANYWGPVARAGPYTEEGGGGGGGEGGAVRGAVPVSPHGPGDIVPAVEMGEGREQSGVESPQAVSPGDGGKGSEGGEFEGLKSMPETAENRAELP